VVTITNAETDATLRNLSVTAGGALTIGTGGSYTGTGTLSNAGTLNLTGGNLTAGGVFSNAGGALSIAAGKTLTVASAASGAANTMTFGVKNSTTVGSIVSTVGAINTTNTSTFNVDLTGADKYIPTTTNAGTAFKIADGIGAATIGAGTVSDNSNLLTFTIVLGNDATIAGSNSDIYLKATRTALSAVTGATANEQAVGTVLDSAAVTASVDPIFTTIQGNLASASTAAGVNSVMESLTPTVDGSASNASMDFTGHVSGLADTRLASLRTGEATGMAAGSSASGMTGWLEGFGQHADQGRRGGIAGYTSNTWGGALGVDSADLLDGGVVGVALSYGVTNANSENANTTDTNIDSYGINLYGSTTVAQNFFLNGQLGYAFNDIDQTRHNVGGIGGPVAVADYSSNQYTARALAGTDYPVEGGLTVTPTASVNYTYLDTQAYTETGLGANEHVNSDAVSALDLGIGLDLGWKFKAMNDGDILKPSLHAGYTYDAIGDTIQTTSSFVGIPAAAAFNTRGPDPARSKGDVGAKVVLETVDNWDLSAAYDFEFRSDYNAHSGWVRAGTKF
jgi:outer membrane autotransporter protein